MGQQTASLFDRVLENPLAILAAGTVLGMYLIGTLEERKRERKRSEDKDDDEAPAFVSEKDRALWEKFRELYQAEIGNPDKPIDERIELLSQNLERLAQNVETLLDRTEPNIKDHQEMQDAKK